MDRCALFVDAGYVLTDGSMAVHGTVRRESVSWNYPGLLQFLATLATERSGLPMLRCYWYDGAADGRRSAEHDALADMPGVKLRLVKTRPGHDGVEDEMHRDLTALARNQAVSDAMIVSAAEELTQVVADVQNLGMRVTLLHVAADGGWTISRTLRQECDDIVEISPQQIRPFAELITGAEPPRPDERPGAMVSARAYANGTYSNGYGATPAANGRAIGYTPMLPEGGSTTGNGYHAPPPVPPSMPPVPPSITMPSGYGTPPGRPPASQPPVSQPPAALPSASAESGPGTGPGNPAADDLLAGLAAMTPQAPAPAHLAGQPNVPAPSGLAGQQPYPSQPGDFQGLPSSGPQQQPGTLVPPGQLAQSAAPAPVQPAAPQQPASDAGQAASDAEPGQAPADDLFAGLAAMPVTRPGTSGSADGPAPAPASPAAPAAGAAPSAGPEAAPAPAAGLAPEPALILEPTLASDPVLPPEAGPESLPAPGMASGRSSRPSQRRTSAEQLAARVQRLSMPVEPQPVSAGQPISQELPVRADAPPEPPPAAPEPAFGLEQPSAPVPSSAGFESGAQPELYPAPVADAGPRLAPAGLAGTSQDRGAESTVTDLAAYGHGGPRDSHSDQVTGRRSGSQPAVPEAHSAQVHHLPYRQTGEQHAVPATGAHAVQPQLSTPGQPMGTVTPISPPPPSPSASDQGLPQAGPSPEGAAAAGFRVTGPFGVVDNANGAASSQQSGGYGPDAYALAPGAQAPGPVTGTPQLPGQPVPGSPPPAQPGYTQPEYAEQEYSQPGYSQPGYEQPEHSQSGYEQGYEQPAYSEPVYSEPEYGEPQLSQPEYGQPPEYGHPNYSQPDYGDAEYAEPESGQPESAAHPGSGSQGGLNHPGPAEDPGGQSAPNAVPPNGSAPAGPPAPVSQAAPGGPVPSHGGPVPSSALSLADAVQSAHHEGQEFGGSVARDAPALWLEAVLARKPRMPSDLEARLLQGSSLPIDFLLHDEVRHALRRGFWDALERARR